jgi:hypothetical protein
MGQYLIDNNVLSNYFTGQLSGNAMNFVSEVIDRIPVISVITVIEALSWHSPDKKYETIIKEFVDNSNILGLSTKKDYNTGRHYSCHRHSTPSYADYKRYRF